MHLIGIIIRIYHDAARSAERQKLGCFGGNSSGCGQKYGSCYCEERYEILDFVKPDFSSTQETVGFSRNALWLTYRTQVYVYSRVTRLAFCNVTRVHWPSRQPNYRARSGCQYYLERGLRTSEPRHLTGWTTGEWWRWNVLGYPKDTHNKPGQGIGDFH